MATSTRTVKRPAIQAPQTLAEAEQALAELGRVQAELSAIKAVTDDRVAALLANAAAKTEPLDARAQQLFDGIHAFATANRDELTRDGKTVTVATGKFSWRWTPAKVSITNVKVVLARLEELGLTRFRRPKYEIDKTAMLKEPDVAGAIQGVEITRIEEFRVDPADAEGMARDVRKVEVTTDAK